MTKKIQISKIILRKGASADLPGAPTSLSPLTFPKGLDAAELAFTTDTGRLYLGQDTTVGSPQHNRVSYPYRNIEVLTENSTDTLSTMVGSALRDSDEKSYHYATLPTHSTDWENVIVPRTGDANYVFRLEYGDNVTATFDYAAFVDGTNLPVKHGTLTVRYYEGEAEPTHTDEASTKRRLDLTEPDASDSTKAYQQVSFRFVVDGPIGGRYLAFQYKNHTNTVLHLRFRTSRPKV